MKNIALVSGPIRNCGIHTYASCVYEILQKSSRYNFLFFEVNTAEEMLAMANQHQVSAVVYNWHPAIMPWCTGNFTRQMQQFAQFLIAGHELYQESEQFDNIRAYLTIDPTLPARHNSFPGIRPITYYDNIQYHAPQGPLKIGTSGFGHQKKGFTRLAQILNEQFPQEPVELNVHFSVGHFVDQTGNAARQSVAEAAGNLNSNIKLNVTHQFFEKPQLIQWLNNNDINVYCYDYYHGPGVSSSIDKAIAARKPFAVNDSNYFKHVRKDVIDLYKTPIKDIVAQGIEPLQEFYQQWNPSTLIAQYEFLMDNFI